MTTAHSKWFKLTCTKHRFSSILLTAYWPTFCLWHYWNVLEVPMPFPRPPPVVAVAWCGSGVPSPIMPHSLGVFITTYHKYLPHIPPPHSASESQVACGNPIKKRNIFWWMSYTRPLNTTPRVFFTGFRERGGGGPGPVRCRKWRTGVIFKGVSFINMNSSCFAF